MQSSNPILDQTRGSIFDRRTTPKSKPAPVDARIESFRFYDAGGWGDDRLGHFYCSCRNVTPNWGGGLAFAGLGRSRGTYHIGRAMLRGTFGHDASRRRNVCLPPRGLLSPLGLP